jgi:hypothetical protein
MVGCGQEAAAADGDQQGDDQHCGGQVPDQDGGHGRPLS